MCGWLSVTEAAADFQQPPGLDSEARFLAGLAGDGVLVPFPSVWLVEIDLRTIYQREITLIGCHVGNRAEIAEFLPLLADGALSPAVDSAVDSVFNLEEAAAAHARLADPERFGKVVLAISGTGE